MDYLLRFKSDPEEFQSELIYEVRTLNLGLIVI